MTADELRAPGTDDPPKGSPTNPYITPRQAAALALAAGVVLALLVWVSR